MAESFKLVRGVRQTLRAEYDLPFAAPWVEAKLGIPATVAGDAIRQLVTDHVLVRAGELEHRADPRETFAPGGVCGLECNSSCVICLGRVEARATQLPRMAGRWPAN